MTEESKLYKERAINYHRTLYNYFKGLLDLFIKGEVYKNVIGEDYWEETINHYEQADKRMRRLGRRIAQAVKLEELKDAVDETTRAYTRSVYKVTNRAYSIPEQAYRVLVGDKEWSK